MPVAFHRFRRQRNDGQFPEARLGANLLHRLIAIHFRHHNIHQHEVNIRARVQLLQRLFAVLRHENIHAFAFHDARQGKNVPHIIINNQHGFFVKHLLFIMQHPNFFLEMLRQFGFNAVQKERHFI